MYYVYQISYLYAIYVHVHVYGMSLHFKEVAYLGNSFLYLHFKGVSYPCSIDTSKVEFPSYNI